MGEVALVARHDVGLAGHGAGFSGLLGLHGALLLHGQGRDEGGLGHVAGQRVGRQWGQHGGHGQGARLSDQLPVENVGEGALDAVVDGAPAGWGRVEIFNSLQLPLLEMSFQWQDGYVEGVVQMFFNKD